NLMVPTGASVRAESSEILIGLLSGGAADRTVERGAGWRPVSSDPTFGAARDAGTWSRTLGVLTSPPGEPIISKYHFLVARCLRHDPLPHPGHRLPPPTEPHPRRHRFPGRLPQRDDDPR